GRQRANGQEHLPPALGGDDGFMDVAHELLESCEAHVVRGELAFDTAQIAVQVGVAVAHEVISASAVSVMLAVATTALSATRRISTVAVPVTAVVPGTARDAERFHDRVVPRFSHVESALPDQLVPLAIVAR